MPKEDQRNGCAVYLIAPIICRVVQVIDRGCVFTIPVFVRVGIMVARLGAPQDQKLEIDGER